MSNNSRDRRIAYLSSFVTPERREKMEAVLAQRTRYVTIALEDIYQPHNASAVLRSCDAFGIQDVHIIENRNEYQVNPKVELGTKQWLTLQRYNRSTENSAEAAESLKNRGYRIVATSPHAGNVNLENFDLTKGKAAFFFGNELNGLSRTVRDMADEFMTIPMFGFVESFNISVSCALSLHHLVHALRNSDLDWHLTGEERSALLLKWLRSSIKNSEVIEEQFEKKEITE